MQLTHSFSLIKLLSSLSIKVRMNNDVTFEKPNVSIILYIYRFVAFVESLSTRSFNNSPYFSFNSALRKEL